MRGNKTDYNTWFKYCCIILILFAGLRNGVGGDTVHYSARFEEWPTLFELFSGDINFSIASQPLWFLMNCTLKSIWNDFTIIQLVHAFIFNALLFKYIRKMTDYPFMVLLFVYCMVWWNLNFEVMRESLCVVIYLNALLYLKEGLVRKYLMCCVPCVFIHYFAIIAIGATLIVSYISNKMLLLIVLITSILISVIDTSFIFDNIVEIVSLFEDDALLLKAGGYIYSDVWGETSLNLRGIIVHIIFLLYPIIIVLNLKDKPKKTIEFRIICLFIVFYILSQRIVILHRFLNYFWIPVILETINYLYEYRIRKSIRFYYILFLLLSTAVGDIQEFYQPSEYDKKSGISYDYRYIPYTSIFEEPNSLRKSRYTYY